MSRRRTTHVAAARDCKLIARQVLIVVIALELYLGIWGVVLNWWPA